MIAANLRVFPDELRVFPERLVTTQVTRSSRWAPKTEEELAASRNGLRAAAEQRRGARA